MLTDHPRPHVAVDLAILCVDAGVLKVVVMPRTDADDVGGPWALPGGFVHLGQSPEETVDRVLREKLKLEVSHFEQLATYGAPDRDPRAHVLSITYLAMVPVADLTAITNDRPDLTLASVAVDWPGEEGGPARLTDPRGAPLPLAFDHAAVLGDVVKRLRGKIDYTPIAFAFLPARFTLRDVQEVHEAVLGHPLTKPAFRRKLLDRYSLRPTGDREAGAAFRPAELYEVSKEKE
jgi:8-oxo-dGTP diphosphatase